MTTDPTAPLAWDKTRRMARRLGIDLPRAVTDGWLTRRDLDGLVVTCEACGKTTCQTDQSFACANTTDLEKLRL